MRMMATTFINDGNLLLRKRKEVDEHSKNIENLHYQMDCIFIALKTKTDEIAEVKEIVAGLVERNV
ncbi:unnamed protein product [Thlaspi arvense]|uniref:Uncharacterized protein n=1 Tax=Thlaspi arvense TaxID=13288 RepID=A0AAU9RCJ2_THLAR|nr:unnamed protein product [Thlaspi arvense]